MDSNEDSCCNICKKKIGKSAKFIKCEICYYNFHLKFNGLADDSFNHLSAIRAMVLVLCPTCKSGGCLKFLSMVPKLIEKQESLATEVINLQEVKALSPTSGSKGTSGSSSSSDSISLAEIEDRERRAKNLVFFGLTIRTMKRRRCWSSLKDILTLRFLLSKSLSPGQSSQRANLESQ